MLAERQPPTGAAAPPLPPTDTLGCQSSKLHIDQEFTAAGIKLYRKRTGDAYVGQVVTPPTDRGFLVGLSMRAGHQRRIFHAHHSTRHDFDTDAVYVRNFADPYRADMVGAFDFLLVEISRSAFDKVVGEEGRGRFDGLVCSAGAKDPVLGHLLRALMPALTRPAEASTLFVDQLAATIGTYLFEQYGGMRRYVGTPGRTQRTLSRQQETRAKEMLSSRLDGDVSVADVADACRLSRSYFIRAFRETTGQTPHQWLLAQRIEHARALLAGSQLSLVEVAAACGFADQSHFTRVFAQGVGTSPGRWRRNAGG
ncbi:MAG: AraC family transcriptional regulator [Rhodoferax sp.]|nr:AraC family transcriptional regulator [Rhodoferax sp.]